MDIGPLDYLLDPAGLLSDIVGISVAPLALKAWRHRRHLRYATCVNATERKDLWIARSAEKD